MITKLTPEQEAMMPEFVKKWVDIGLNTDPCDRDKAREGVIEAYKAAGLEPPQQIIFLKSPYQLCFAKGVYETLFDEKNKDKLEAFTRYRFSKPILMTEANLKICAAFIDTSLRFLTSAIQESAAEHLASDKTGEDHSSAVQLNPFTYASRVESGQVSGEITGAADRQLWALGRELASEIHAAISAYLASHPEQATSPDDPIKDRMIGTQLMEGQLQTAWEKTLPQIGQDVKRDAWAMANEVADASWALVGVITGEIAAHIDELPGNLRDELLDLANKSGNDASEWVRVDASLGIYDEWLTAIRQAIVNTIENALYAYLHTPGKSQDVEIGMAKSVAEQASIQQTSIDVSAIAWRNVENADETLNGRAARIIGNALSGVQDATDTVFVAVAKQILDQTIGASLQNTDEVCEKPEAEIRRMKAKGAIDPEYVKSMSLKRRLEVDEKVAVEVNTGVSDFKVGMIDAVSQSIRDTYNAVRSKTGDQANRDVKSDIYMLVHLTVGMALRGMLSELILNELLEQISKDTAFVGKSIKHQFDRQTHTVIGNWGKIEMNTNSSQVRDWLNALYEAVTTLKIDISSVLRELFEGEKVEELQKSAKEQFYLLIFGNQEWGLAYYDYMRAIGVKGTEPLDGLMKIAQSAGWWIPYKNVAFVADRPKSILRDEQGRLNSLDTPAVEYRDGFAVYSVHGVRVPDYVIMHPEQITPQKIEAESNVEVRRVMIEKYGQDRYLKDSEAVLIHQDKYGKLWRKEQNEDEPLVMVQVTNATPEPTGEYRDYFIRVPPVTRTAKGAVAWSFGMTEEEYDPTVQS